MVAWVAVLYFGYFYIQSTDMELWRQFLLNGINSTVRPACQKCPA